MRRGEKRLLRPGVRPCSSGLPAQGGGEGGLKDRLVLGGFACCCILSRPTEIYSAWSSVELGSRHFPQVAAARPGRDAAPLLPQGLLQSDLPAAAAPRAAPGRAVCMWLCGGVSCPHLPLLALVEKAALGRHASCWRSGGRKGGKRPIGWRLRRGPRGSGALHLAGQVRRAARGALGAGGSLLSTGPNGSLAGSVCSPRLATSTQK